MTSVQCKDQLLTALSAMRIEANGAALSFTKKLARDNGWDDSYAARIDAEYRRFLYLAATLGQPVTPSVAIDKAWHLHLTYTRHYWDVLCGDILKRPLHHDPSDGLPEQDTHFGVQYRRTLTAYEQSFGAPPPADIWPSDTKSPATAAKPSRRWPRPKARWAVFAALPLLSGCAFSGQGVGLIFLFIAAAILFAGWGAIKQNLRPGRKPHTDDGSGGFFDGYDSDSGDSGGSDGGSCGGGGCGGD